MCEQGQSRGKSQSQERTGLNGGDKTKEMENLS